MHAKPRFAIIARNIRPHLSGVSFAVMATIAVSNAHAGAIRTGEVEPLRAGVEIAWKAPANDLIVGSPDEMALTPEVQRVASPVSCGEPISDAVKAALRQRVEVLATQWMAFHCGGLRFAHDCADAVDQTRDWLVEFLTQPTAARWQYTANLANMHELIDCKSRVLMTWRGFQAKERDHALRQCDVGILPTWCDGWRTH